MKHTIFETKEQYLNAIKAWRDTCKDKSFQFTAEHFALYAIIRGKDPKECFASPEKQSEKKLRCQGKTGEETYKLAMHRIKSGYMDAQLLEPFQGTLTVPQLLLMRDAWDEENLEEMKLQRMGAM